MTGGSSLRYTLVGGTCALVHNVIMIVGDLLGAHYALSSVLSYVVVVALGYGLHTSFTFRAARSLAGFVKYAVPVAANVPASLALLFVLCDLLGLPVPLAAPAATVILFVANYALARWAILGSARLQDG